MGAFIKSRDVACTGKGTTCWPPDAPWLDAPGSRVHHQNMNSEPDEERRLTRLERRVESLSEAAIVQGRLQWRTDRTVSDISEDLQELADRLGVLTGIVENSHHVLFAGLDGLTQRLEGLTQRLDRLEALIERYIQGRNGHGGDPS